MGIYLRFVCVNDVCTDSGGEEDVRGVIEFVV